MSQDRIYKPAQQPYNPINKDGLYKGPKKVEKAKKLINDLGSIDLTEGIDELVNKDNLADEYQQDGGQ